MAINSSTYWKIGQPSAYPTSRGDTAEELTLLDKITRLRLKNILETLNVRDTLAFVPIRQLFDIINNTDNVIFFVNRFLEDNIGTSETFQIVYLVHENVILVVRLYSSNLLDVKSVAKDVLSYDTLASLPVDMDVKSESVLNIKTESRNALSNRTST